MQDLATVIPSHPHSAALQGQLQAGENVVATLEVDLDADGRFAPGLIALTDSRLSPSSRPVRNGSLSRSRRARACG